MASEITHLWAVISAALGQMPFPPTQSKFAERLGLSRATISEWKYGHTTPTPENMRAIARELEPVLGPTALVSLIEAMNRDGGYLPSIPANDRGRLAARESTKRKPQGPVEQAAD